MANNVKSSSSLFSSCLKSDRARFIQRKSQKGSKLFEAQHVEKQSSPLPNNKQQLFRNALTLIKDIVDSQDRSKIKLLINFILFSNSRYYSENDQNTFYENLISGLNTPNSRDNLNSLIALTKNNSLLFFKPITKSSIGLLYSIFVLDEKRNGGLPCQPRFNEWIISNFYSGMKNEFNEKVTAILSRHSNLDYDLSFAISLDQSGHYFNKFFKEKVNLYFVLNKKDSEITEEDLKSKLKTHPYIIYVNEDTNNFSLITKDKDGNKKSFNTFIKPEKMGKIIEKFRKSLKSHGGCSISSQYFDDIVSYNLHTVDNHNFKLYGHTLSFLVDNKPLDFSLDFEEIKKESIHISIDSSEANAYPSTPSPASSESPSSSFHSRHSSISGLSSSSNSSLDSQISHKSAPFNPEAFINESNSFDNINTLSLKPFLNTGQISDEERRIFEKFTAFLGLNGLRDNKNINEIYSNFYKYIPITERDNYTANEKEHIKKRITTFFILPYLGKIVSSYNNQKD